MRFLARSKKRRIIKKWGKRTGNWPVNFIGKPNGYYLYEFIYANQLILRTHNPAIAGMFINITE